MNTSAKRFFYNHVNHQLNPHWLRFTLVLTYLVHYAALTDYHDSITPQYICITTRVSLAGLYKVLPSYLRVFLSYF